ncbi:MAG: hypothetical protein US89_C0009G0058 [Candidatus Peregrinibacteria bacterium GW2011_GWF2_38_29]|nr:MAG: hypothetical protein US89_C0009G0058 [Candidatus Peregrinibacteria bacterium GW2011_GWF2_38_29]
MTPGPDTYRDPSDAAEAAPVLSPGARIAIETALASDESWKATMRDETMPLKTTRFGKVWHFHREGIGMIYGRTATALEVIRDTLKKPDAPSMTVVGRHETSALPIYLCDAEGNLILSEKE